MLNGMQCPGQTGKHEDGEFIMTLEAKASTWNPHQPLVVEVIFKNTGRRTVFLDLKRNFQFNGFLKDSSGNDFRVKWKPEGTRALARRTDYTKLIPGSTYRIALTSYRIEDHRVLDEFVSWDSHQPGIYKLVVSYASGTKTRRFTGQWAGQRISNQLELRVE